MTEEAVGVSGQNNTLRYIIIGVIVVVFLCCCCAAALYGGLLLMGPEIGDVFSNIIEELGAPTP